jgi:hypothetical protein
MHLSEKMLIPICKLVVIHTNQVSNSGLTSSHKLESVLTASFLLLLID